MPVGLVVPMGCVTVSNTPLESVNSFTYLGSNVCRNGDTEADTRSRIGKASAVFCRLQLIWSSSTISINVKFRLYDSIILSTVLYASETWTMSACVQNKVNTFHHRCLRYTDQIQVVWRQSGFDRLDVIVVERWLRLKGPIFRMPRQHLPLVAMNWIQPGSKHGRGALSYPTSNSLIYHGMMPQPLR